MNHAHRSLQDLAGVSRHLKLAREQAEALARAQAEARAANLGRRDVGHQRIARRAAYPFADAVEQARGDDDRRRGC